MARSARAARLCSNLIATLPETSGYLREKEKANCNRCWKKRCAKGIEVETHAIGDRANRIILDFMSTLSPRCRSIKRPIAEARWRVEHAQILRRCRFAALRQTTRDRLDAAVARDQRFIFRAEPCSGLDRLSGAYAWQRLLRGDIIGRRLRCAGRAG